MAVQSSDHTINQALRYDPKMKQNIYKALMDFLYTPTQKSLHHRLETIVVKNTLLGKYSHKSFMYQGKLYNTDLTHPPLRRNRLLPELVPLMDEYLRDVAQIQDEQQIVNGFIVKTLNASNEVEDYLKVLPQALHRPLQQFISECANKQIVLTEEDIANLRSTCSTAIDLIKQRMVINLLI